MTSFTKTKTKFAEHDKQQCHLAATCKAGDFLKVMCGHQQNIQFQMNDALADRVRQNHLKMASIIKTMIICGRQNIPLRGDRDSLKDVLVDKSANHGNFLALLDFIVEAGDSELGEHLTTAARNVVYTFFRIQNEHIQIYGENIWNQIIEKVKLNKFYSMIADEATDCSSKEQLALVLRLQIK